jgi:hypothetical protein
MAKQDKPMGICPDCLGQFRLVSRGVMVRHGFNAKNVRHGQNGGFHTGPCQGVGQQPIGTEGGNAYAARLAVRLRGWAADEEAKPAYSSEEALAAQIWAAQDSHFDWQVRRGQPISAEQRAAFSTPEAFAHTSVRGWFDRGLIEWRRFWLQLHREERVESWRAHAAALDAAVAAHPVRVAV